jgi:PAS domain S-box-containing protein
MMNSCCTKIAWKTMTTGLRRRALSTRLASVFDVEDFSLELKDYIERNKNQLMTADHWNRPVIHQVSEKLAAERELPKSMTEAMKDPRPCVITSAEDPSTIVNVNDAWLRCFGYLREEALNQNIRDLLHGPDTEIRVADAIVEHIENGDASAQGILTHYTKMGRKFKDLMRLGVISVADGSMEYVVGVMHKIPNKAHA